MLTFLPQTGIIDADACDPVTRFCQILRRSLLAEEQIYAAVEQDRPVISIPHDDVPTWVIPVATQPVVISIS
jgi:hypothetical protein